MSINDGENDPYFRSDPGVGGERFSAHRFDIEKDFSKWKIWRTNDGRCLPNMNSRFELIDNPFDPGSLVLLTTNYDPAVSGKSFGGFGIRVPIEPALLLNEKTFVEFDLYYPKSVSGEYMRFEIWSTSSGGEGSQKSSGFSGTDRTQIYIRAASLENIRNTEPDWIGFYKNETWYKKQITVVTPVSSGNWEYLNIDIHTENNVKVVDGLLMIGNLRITQPDSNTKPIPDVVNSRMYSEVIPVKEKYNPGNGYFFIGTTGMKKITEGDLRGTHFEIIIEDNEIKPECHITPPLWLIEKNPDFKFHCYGETNCEWKIPTDNFLDVLHSGDKGTFKLHGHCLAWSNQSPSWMRQIIPENISSMEWNPQGLFYSGGTNATGPFLKTNKETARRLYFDHIMYLMRHFMSTEKRYGSSPERGLISFHSFDVLNEEIHESRHTAHIQENPDKWKNSLKHISWLMAMTDNDVNDTKQHYVYLLFKYAHIAVPNAQMAQKFKDGYNDPNIVPDYMKLDSHDTNGSIDSYISEKPPILSFNESEIGHYTKAKTAYNMIKELNTLWKDDPLYDGRNLIECMGIQGHETVGGNIASRNMRSLALFTDLIDKGLLDSVCFSEVDIRLPDTSPGGGAPAPAVLNQKQADAVGYQYALLFKLFDKYKKYIDRVNLWSPAGAGWQGGYVLFDQEGKASQAYYAIMDPDRFIQGHSYLDCFFQGEYEKI